LARDC